LDSRRLLAVVVALGLALGASPAGAIVFDSFVTPLPPNPRLPVTGQRIVFVGSHCDAAACPPAEPVYFSSDHGDQARQVDVAGVHGGTRDVHVTGEGWIDDFPDAPLHGAYRAEVWIDPGAGGNLHVVANDAPHFSMLLNYGTNPGFPAVDFDALGLDRIELELLDLSPGAVLTVIVQVVGGVSPVSTGGIGLQFAEGPGVVSFPIHAFLDPPDDWRSIRSVFFSFSVDGTGPLAFTIGEVRAVAGAVPAAPTSWGRIKDAYRR